MQTIFDYDLIESFRRRALVKNTNGVDFLLRRMADDLEERLLDVERIFTHGLDLHGHTGLAASAMERSQKVQKIERMETQAGFSSPFTQAHRENLQLTSQSFDLISSLLSLQMVNDVPGVLMQIKRALRPDGLFLGVMAGGGTLGELRESLLQAESELYGGVHPRIYPFIDVREAGALLQRAGFALPVSDIETLNVRYDTMFDLMRDLRSMGMQNALISRSHRPVSRRFFVRAAEIYAERFSDPDGRIRATFSFISLSGWAPHEGQQKPMQPGTAKVSLKSILEEK